MQRALDENKLKERTTLLIKPELHPRRYGISRAGPVPRHVHVSVDERALRKGRYHPDSNKRYGELGQIFADNVIPSAKPTGFCIARHNQHQGESYRLEDKKMAGVIAAKTTPKEAA